MEKLINVDNHIESTTRKTELVEEFLDILDYEQSDSSLIRMEMNVIEFPIFSKNPRVKKNQILKYYFSKDKQSYLEITPPNNESIPGEFDERVFISLLKVMKKKGGKAIFYCSLSDIVDSLNIPATSKKAFYSKIKNSVLKLSKTNYSFFNLFYLGSLNKRVDDLINTPLITSRIITLKEADESEKNLFSDKRVKEIYRIRIADDIYGNITDKGYLVFDADVLLSITDPIVRSLHTQITKWRNSALYLKKTLVYIAKKIPLSLKGTMIYSTSKKINDSLQELKKLDLISDFNYSKDGNIEKSEFEIFFNEKHNKYKQELFYEDKKDHNNLIHSVEERLNNYSCYDDCNVSRIADIFGSKGVSLKTLPNVIKEALKTHNFDYVQYTAEYTILNAKVSLLKYFKEALLNNWADEYIAKKESKKRNKKPVQTPLREASIEEAIIVPSRYTWEKYCEFSQKIRDKIEDETYKSFLETAGIDQTKSNRKIFERAKKSLILQWMSDNDDPINQISFENVKIIEIEKGVQTKKYNSFAQFIMEIFPVIKKNNPDYELRLFNDVLLLFGTYEDSFIKIDWNLEKLESTIIKK